MASLAIDESAYKAASAQITDGKIYIELLNGRRVSAPIWLFEELAGFSDDELDDVEVIEAGRGILVGDREAVTVARLLGLDATNPEAHVFKPPVQQSR